eukprot:GHVS01101354.1.p1 GENE.GHVS01101354.1~~GHVS01101354.1.p1  ORF type:complete len:991 (-),score=117.35 GHVS01101354.1:852-3824(-)
MPNSPYVPPSYPNAASYDFYSPLTDTPSSRNRRGSGESNGSAKGGRGRFAWSQGAGRGWRNGQSDCSGHGTLRQGSPNNNLYNEHASSSSMNPSSTASWNASGTSVPHYSMQPPPPPPTSYQTTLRPTNSTAAHGAPPSGTYCVVPAASPYVDMPQPGYSLVTPQPFERPNTANYYGACYHDSADLYSMGWHHSTVETGKDVRSLVASVSTSVPTSPCSGSHPPMSPHQDGVVPNGMWEEAGRLMVNVACRADIGPGEMGDRFERSANGSSETRAHARMQPISPSAMLPSPILPISPSSLNLPPLPFPWPRPQMSPRVAASSANIPSVHHQQAQPPTSSLLASPLTDGSQASRPSGQVPQHSSVHNIREFPQTPCSPPSPRPTAVLPSPPPAPAAQLPSNAHKDTDRHQISGPQKMGFVSGFEELSNEYLVRGPLAVCGDINNNSRPMLNEAACRKTLAGRIIKSIQKDRVAGNPAGLDEWRSMSAKIMNIPSHRSLMKIVEVKESPGNFFVISEKLEGGELFDYLLTEPAIPEETCKHMMRQIGKATSILHSNNLVHRDIKPENLMFRYTRNNAQLDHSVGMSSKRYRKLHELALIDFDTCKLLTSPPEVRGGRRRLVGTYGYLAPEVLKHGRYTEMSDLWSIGVILYILMTGIAPLPLEAMVGSRETLAVLLKAEEQGIDFNVPPLSEFPLARDLCQRLLCFDVAHRCSSTAEMLAHPWLFQAPWLPSAPSRSDAAPSTETHDDPASSSSTVECPPKSNDESGKSLESSKEQISIPETGKTLQEKVEGHNTGGTAASSPGEKEERIIVDDTPENQKKRDSAESQPTSCGSNLEDVGHPEQDMVVGSASSGLAVLQQPCPRSLHQSKQLLSSDSTPPTTPQSCPLPPFEQSDSRVPHSVRRHTLTDSRLYSQPGNSPCSMGHLVDDCCLVRAIEAAGGSCCTSAKSSSKVADNSKVPQASPVTCMCHATRRSTGSTVVNSTKQDRRWQQ